MSDWKPDLYLAFEKERTQPSIDLVMKIEHENPARIIDIGCGPGNSTNVLCSRWPQAQIIGLDSSQAMIEKAQATYPHMNWLRADAAGDLSVLGQFDIVFSNAAIQWIPNQEKLLANLFNLLRPGGVLAVQVPSTSNMPVNVELRNLAAATKWQPHFASPCGNGSVRNEHFYYDVLCSFADAIEMWVTNYCHVMGSHAEIVTWYSGSGLRPYLDSFDDESKRNAFLQAYEQQLRDAYPAQKDGKILFPFTRIFFTAKKGETP
ncbi:MAG: methyltransferase domain-containing protein [Oscillospiraceae bacterium]|nr:methyltransferase domain-containing protein [Oscillospiraceae bacterium]